MNMKAGEGFYYFYHPLLTNKVGGQNDFTEPEHERNLLNECDNLSVNKSWD